MMTILSSMATSDQDTQVQDKIISASEFIKLQDDKKKRCDEARLRREEDRIKSLQQATGEFVEHFYSVAITAINMAISKETNFDKDIRMSLNHDKKYFGFFLDVLLYGELTEVNLWTERKPWDVGQSPFVQVQEKLAKDGWIVIEELSVDDDEYIFNIYSQEPDVSHPYYNKPIFWHSNNCFKWPTAQQ